MNFYAEFVKMYQEAISSKYPGQNLVAGWQMPVSVQVTLLDTAADLDAEEKRFYLDMSPQGLTSTEEKIQLHGLPDEIESFQEDTQQIVTVAAGGERTIKIRQIEIPLLYPDALLDEGNIVGNKAKFLANMDGQIGGRIIEASVWAFFNGTSQATYFQKNEPEKSNIGFPTYLKANYATHVISEKISGSGVITVGAVRKVPCNGAVTDEGGGKVGIPAPAHGFPAGAKIFTVGTTNYKAPYTVDEDSTADKVVVTAAYNAETLNASDHFLVLIPDYRNLDELVSDMLQTGLIPDEKKRRWQAIGSRNLFGVHKTEHYGQSGMDPEKKVKIESAASLVGGLGKYSLPSMPNGSILFSDPKNLKRGFHKNSAIRTAKYDEDRRGLVIRHKYYRGCAIADPEAVLYVENIVIIKPFMSV